MKQKASYELASILLDNLEAMVAYWNKEEICLYANNAYLSWFGKTHEQMMGIRLKELLGPELYEKNSPYRIAAYAGSVQVFERAITTPQGKIRYSLATYTPHIQNGVVQGIFVHVADVTPLKLMEHELRIAKEKAEALATHDFLTGLPNRVLLNDRIEQAVSQSKRTQRMFAGASLDLDDFKKVNDTHGHAAGDKLLIEISTRMKNSVRELDTVTRLGGDEFFILFPEIGSKSELEILAHRLLNSIGIPFTIDGQVVNPACSLGIVVVSNIGISPKEFMDQSDKALYAAKKKGKNQYELVDYSPAH